MLANPSHVLTITFTTHTAHTQGIKIKDSESKKQVMELLKAEQANKMDVEDIPRLVVAHAGRMRRATSFAAAASKGGLGIKTSSGVQKKKSSSKAVAMIID